MLPFRCNDVAQSPPYLFLAEGIDEMLAVRSGAPRMKTDTGVPAASLPGVCADDGTVVGCNADGTQGTPITAVVEQLSALAS